MTDHRTYIVGRTWRKETDGLLFVFSWAEANKHNQNFKQGVYSSWCLEMGVLYVTIVRG